MSAFTRSASRPNPAEIRTKALQFMQAYGILVALVVLIAIVQSQNAEFLSKENLLNIASQWAAVGIMAVGMTFVLIGGGFDLSVGATFAFSATLGASLVQGHPATQAVIVAVAVGVLVGAVNGFLVTAVNVNPFVTTLSTALMVRGAALIYSDGQNYVVSRGSEGNAFFDWLGDGKIATVPVPLVILILAFVVGGALLSFTVYGRSVYAVGGNEEAAYLSGVRVALVRGSTYAIAGVLAAIAGLIWVGRLGSGAPNIGVGIEFDVIAAALIGGISLAGGEGAMWRAAAGVAFLAVLQNFFNQSHIDAFVQTVIKGLIILIAVAADSYAKRPHKRPLRATLASAAASTRRALRLRPASTRAVSIRARPEE